MTTGNYVRAVALRMRAGSITRYLVIGSFALAEVFIVFALHGFISHRLHAQWNATYELEIFQRQLIAGLLPVPIAFLFWLRALEREGRFDLRYSPVMAAASIVGFAATFFLVDHPYLMQTALVLGVVGGLFVFIPFVEWARKAAGQPRVACIALIAATASMDYYWVMQHSISHALLFLSGAMATIILDMFGMDIIMTESLSYSIGYSMYSKYFMINLVPFCCGFEGIFQFFFVLSVMLLGYWERFKNRRLWTLYGLGAAVISMINAVRIAVLFSIGHWAYTPGVPEWVQSLKGTPFEMFHSWTGWILYQLAFAGFAVWLCKSSMKQESPS